MLTVTPSCRSAVAWLWAPEGWLLKNSRHVLVPNEDGENDFLFPLWEVRRKGEWGIMEMDMVIELLREDSPGRNHTFGVDNSLPGNGGVVEVLSWVGGEVFEAEADLARALCYSRS